MSALETLPVATAFASSRYDALRLAETLRPDVIVVDAELRGTEGWAICEELSERDGAVESEGAWTPSFILLHGEGGETIERAKALGLDQLLRWPFAVDEARSLLEVHLAEPGYGSGGYGTEDLRSEASAFDDQATVDTESSEGLQYPSSEAETPSHGWPPLEVEPPLDSADSDPEGVEAVVDDLLEEPGDGSAAIAMLEPKADSASPEVSPGREEGSGIGSVALFPGVQPLPSSPPPIANLFAMMGDAPSGHAEGESSSEVEVEAETREAGESSEASLEGDGPSDGYAESSEKPDDAPLAEAPAEEAPEFVDVVEEVRADVAPVPAAPVADEQPEDVSPPSPPPPPVAVPISTVDAGEADGAQDEASDDGLPDVPVVPPIPVGNAGVDEPETAPTLDAVAPEPVDLSLPDEVSVVIDDEGPPTVVPAEVGLADTGSNAADAAITEAEPADATSPEEVPLDLVAEESAVEVSEEEHLRSVLVEADLGEEIFVASPPREEPDEIGLDALPPPANRPALAPTLADLFNADGVTQVLLLERAGGVVFTSSKTPQLSMSQLAQHSLELFSCADLVLGATDTGSEGTTDALVAEGPAGCVLLQSVDDHFLVVCVAKNSGLGQVRFLVRRVLEPLRAVLAEE